VQKSILARKLNNRNTINIKLRPNTINRDVGSLNDKEQKVLLKDMRASIPEAAAVYLSPKMRLHTSHVPSAGALNRRQVKWHYVHYASLWGSEGTHPLFLNSLRTGSFKLFKRPFPGFLTILTL
jgi:hypothetical protein